MARSSTRADEIRVESVPGTFAPITGIQSFTQEGGDSSDVDLSGIGDLAPVSDPGPADPSTATFELNYDPNDVVHQFLRTNASNSSSAAVNLRYIYTGAGKREDVSGKLSGWKLNHATSAPRKATFKMNFSSGPTLVANP